MDDQDNLKFLVDVCSTLSTPRRKGLLPQVYHHPEIPCKIMKNARSITPSLQPGETPILLADRVGYSFLWHTFSWWRKSLSFLERAGHTGLLITTKAIYENVRWPSESYNKPIMRKQFPLNFLHSVQRAQLCKQNKILLNGIPLWGLGLSEDSWTHTPEFEEGLYHIFSKICERVSPGRSLPLLDVIKFYEGFDLVSNHHELKDGPETAARRYREFNPFRDQILFQKIKTGRDFLVTDKNIFSYNRNVSDSTYQVWDLKSVRAVRVDHTTKSHPRSREVWAGIYINDINVWSLNENTYNNDKSHWEIEMIYPQYIIGAMICGIVNVQRESNPLAGLTPTVTAYGSRGPRRGIDGTVHEIKDTKVWYAW